MPYNPDWPRALATLLMGGAVVVLTTTIFSWWSLGPVKLQPLMVVVVSAGFNLPLALGGLVVMALGYLNDVLSGGFVGVSMLAMMVAFVISATASRLMVITAWPLQMIMVGLMYLLAQVVVLGGLALAEKRFLAPDYLWWLMVGQALLNAVVAPLVFQALERLVALVQRAWPKGKGVTVN